MPAPAYNSLLDTPTYPAERYAPLADRLKRLLATESDLLFIQAEAILSLEAIATSIARPGLSAINVITSPYGAYFGAWLRRGGVAVTDVVAEPGQPIAASAVKAAIAALPSVDIVAVVHGEAANGALNPIATIAADARAAGALVVVDAVASFGGHPLAIDALGIDIAAIGPQKALGGPVGLSAVTVSARGWAAIGKVPSFSPSILSLQELKENWLDRGRGVLPGTPSPLEFWALEAAIDRIEAEGLETLVARHQLAARASRAGLRALGLEPWIRDDDAASALVTAAPVPAGVDAEALIAAAGRFGVALGRGFGDIKDRLVRFDHTGARAAFPSVVAAVVAYGAALEGFGIAVDVGAAAEAVARSYAKAAA
ncbi:aspartate aminotransferase-like enzyme [Kaistia hirudinis]|uniref:Aspartate aminotransferase-like enzyme n=1 Tax=Kaistia hirudinis TaxID=1293440 RepID=A0A840ASI6_9HYPH|nr:aminotransferase class V-fold PLP-dependent enzyme [Kaistia hirudinis]MBB3931761.1 aspartate aminotransferase-like enzyme [Kaistia hirudinis]